MLLSVDLPTGSEAIIQQGLESLKLWANEELEQLDELNQILPLFGSTLGDLIDIGQRLQDKILAPVNNYLGGVGLTSQGLADALELVLGSPVTDLSDSSRLLFQVDFHFDQTKSVDLSLGANKFGLEFAEGSSLNATISLDFDFSFGVDLTAGLAPSEAFFIEVPEGGPAPTLSVGLTVDVEDADNVSFDIKVGMLEATADLENLDATATVDAAFMDPNGDGMLTRAEWEGTPVSSVVDLSAGPTSGLENAAVDATINVAASLGAYSASGEITILDENLFDTSAPDVDFTAAQDLQDFSNLSPGDLVAFLSELGTSLQGVASALNPSGGIPLLSSALDQLANFQDMMADLAGGLFDIELRDAVSYQAPTAPASGGLQDNAVLHLAIITIEDSGEQTIGPEATITLTPGDVSAAAGATTLLKIVSALETKIGATALSGLVDAAPDNTGTFLILGAIDSSKRLFVRYQGDDRGMRQLGFTPRLANAVFRFDSVQEFIEFLEDEIEEVIPAFNPDVQYNTSSELTFDLQWQMDFSRSLPLDFTQAFEIPGGLGTLAITGHVTALAAAKASLNARVGLDLSPLGSGFTADAGDTLISLNGGAGVQNVVGENDLTFRLRDNTEFHVNIDSAVDLGDVVDLIEGASGFLADGVTHKVEVSFIEDDPDTLKNEAVGLKLEDKTAGTHTFRILVFDGAGETSLAGLGLGILGSDVDGDGVIVGTGLHGDTLLKHAFIEDGAAVSTELTVSATGIYLTASWGILEAGITNGRAGFKVTGGAQLDGDSGRISLSDLVFGAGQASLVGDPVAAGGVLASDATFSINVNGHGAVAVTVAASSTSGNTTLADLAFDLNQALKATSFTSPAYDGTPFEGMKLGDFLTATAGNGKITIAGSAASQGVERVESLAISATNAETNTKLGFQNGDSASSVVVMPTLSVMGTVDIADPDLAVRLPITVAGLEAFDIGIAKPEIVGDAAVATGVLTVDATFSISVDGGAAVPVTVLASATTGNTDLAGLVVNLNAALDGTAFSSDYDGTPFEGKNLGDFITAEVDGTAIKLTGSVQSLSISATNAETNTKLGFQNGDADVSPDTRIDLNIASNSPISLTPELAGLDASTFQSLLDPFSDFSLASLLKLAEQILGFIKDSDLGIFSDPLPLVDRSVKDILSFLDEIESAITTVKDAVAGFKNDALDKLEELQADGGLLDQAAAALTAAGEAELGEQLLEAVEAIQHAVHSLPDSLSDALEFPSSPQLFSGLASLKATLRDITDNTSVNVDDLKKEAALLRNTIPSASTVAKYLFNLVGLDDLVGFDLQTIFDQKAALETALGALDATQVTDALKAKFRGILDDLKGALVESFADPDGTDPLSGSDISDWNPSQVLKAIADLRTAIGDLDTEIAGIGDPDNDDEEAARDLIQTVVGALTGALPAALDVSFLNSGADEGIVFRFHYSKELLQESLKLDFEIPVPGDLPIPFGVKSGGEFNIDLTMSLDIGFGLDFSDLSDPASVLFLTGDSSFEVTALVDFPVTADVTIGGITASLTGNIKIQEDVDDGVQTDPAKLKVTLGGTETDRVTLGAIGGSLDTSESAGELKANVDAEVPVLGTVTDAIVVTADLTDFDPFDITLNLDLELAQLDLAAIVQMIETFLGFVADGLTSELMTKLPLVGDIDFDTAATFIKDIRDQLANIRTLLEAIDPTQTDPLAIQQQITDILNNALGAGGPAPGLLTGLGLITITDVEVLLPNLGDLISDPEAEVSVRFQIGFDDPIVAPFNPKLPGLGLLSGDVGIDLSLAGTVDFGVRVTKTGGPAFLLNTDADDPELEFGIEVNVKPNVVLDLFFLQLQLMDNTPAVPELDFDVNIDVEYAGGTAVPLLEVPDLDFGFDLIAEVNLDILLTASTDLIPNFPTLSTVFVLDWMFNFNDPVNPAGLTYVAFEDITLNLGEFLAGPIGEIFDALDTFIDPLRPLLDFLNAEIPLISQVSQLVGQGPFTFLDGIRLLGEGGDTVATVVEILDSIADAVAAVQVDPNDPVFKVNFGDYVLVDKSQPLTLVDPIADLSNELLMGGDLTSALGTNWAEDAGYGSSYASDEGGLFGTLGDEGGQGMLGISFPLLQDPKQIVNLIFGKAVDLVVWDVPRLEAKFEFSQLFGPIIPPFPVFARIAGSFGIFADFLVGLDTRGLQTGNFINGLFLGDRTPTTAQGEDVPELGLTMEFTAGAELNIAFARAGVEGGVGAGIFANFHDPNNDGKFYLDEVLDRASMGPECIFDLEGALTAFLRAYLNIEIPLGFTSITIIDVDFTIIEVTLFDFSITCPPLPPPVPAHLSDGGSGATDPDTWNGTTTNLPNGTTLIKDTTTFEAGTLILHAGSFSDLRQPGASDIADEIKIRGEGEFDGEAGFGQSSYDGSTDEFDASQVTASMGNGVVVEASESATGASGDIIRDDLNNDGDNMPDVILVEAYGVTHVYTGVQRIVIDAGENGEEDSILIDALSVRVPVTVLGGGGDDEIQTGTANDVILAGAGQDAIAAGAGNDRVSGGDDNDEIFGNAGADIITGGGGDDTIYGGDNDHVDDGDGADNIEGNAGNDRVYGALGNDVLRGQEGTDQIHGGAGADELHGGPEDDQLFGDEDADFAAPPDGVGQGDFMIGGPGNDQLSGGVGADRMIGGGIVGSSDGGDLMEGGSGDDTMIGDVGNLAGGITLTGGAGNDTMIGGSGNDQMYGQGGADEMYGDGSVDGETHSILPDEGSGTDYMEGNADGDTMFGGQLDDRMIGGSSSVPAVGLDAADLMFGGDGADIMLGDNGTITGNDGDVDTDPLGGSGADTLFGGIGADVLFGGGRGDRLSGSTGNDVIVGDQGTRSAAAIKAEHSAEANSSGDDVISGSEGMDTLLGGEGDDQIAGDENVDIAIGDNGMVTLTGGVPTQIETTEFAFGGNDTITGSGAPDILLGGSGADLITGGGDSADDIMLGDNGVVRDNNAGPGDDNDIFSNDPAGAIDTVDGGPGNDIMLGGTAGDILVGGSGDDLILGDHGNVERNSSEAVRFIETVFGSFNGKNFAGAGGVDTISGKAGTDLALGGQAGDIMYGDGATPGAGDDRDILLGDNGEITLVDPLGPGAGMGPDAIVTFNGAVSELHSTDLTAAEGGSDAISGNAANDILAGGVVGDVLHGNEGDDIALGDNALLDWLYAGGDPDFAHLEAGFTFDATFTTLDLIATLLPVAHPGGRDTIFGDAGDDVLLGGEDADTVFGDDGDESGVAAANDDILFGDHGAIYPHNSALAGFPSRNFFSIDTGDDDAGEGDRLFGEEGNDLLLGQQGDDRIFGGDDDDDLIGGHNVAGGIDELSAPAVEVSLNPDKNDIMDGGSGDDALAGDNAEIWRKADETSPRFRALTGQTLYDPLAGPGGQAQVTGAEQLDPRGSVGRTTLLLDHTAALQALAGARPWGADVMAGNSEHDLLFGQLGDELMQGDGSIDAVDDGLPGPTHELTITDSGLPSTAGTLFFNVAEADTDGDDYLEGNGGGDLAYGNLGQDDIIGGSSALFGLATPNQRPDGSDVIFGGAGTPARIARNAETAGDDLLVPQDDRHAVDSDTILGDNGAIYRIVGTNGVGSGAFLTFNYDALDPDRGAVRVIPRAVDLLDYLRGAGDTLANGVAHGAGDTIHGESGDDAIQGMIGTDLLYGDSEDDDVLGGAGHDWVTGGTGEDGILGDDGFLFTSRNGDPGEPLHGVAALPASELDRFIKTPGGIQQAILNVSGQLKKSVNLEAFLLGGDDILYGGLGDDFMHGGFGSDAMSGAEALELSAAQVGGARMTFAYVSPSNPGGVLSFEAFAPDEFALYDEFEPLRRIELDANGQLVKGGGQPGPFVEFLLNFEAFTDAGNQVGTQIHDGNDVLFGDDGPDWLVGGTDQDHLFGGFGADLMNADDNLATNGGLNDFPDVPAFTGTSTIPGQLGADTAFGGGGRDVLLANSGADRLIDWIGEFNAFVVPFAPFGEFTVSRSLLPQLPAYLYAVSKSDGADQTRSFDTGSDPARNGEPNGEIALVLQQDPLWQAQTGAPDDPQAGNKPGGKKDTMEAADFSSGQGQMASELGSWSVVSGRYQSAAGGQALSIIHVKDQLPSHVFLEATLNLAKPATGALANGNLVFDYKTPTDFKFAGLSASLGKLVIGQRTAQGWAVLGQATASIKTNRDYSVQVSLEGNLARLTVDGVGQLSWAFTDQLNDGMLAMGADNSVARFDDIKVWRNRDPLGYAVAEDLSDGVAERYVAGVGSWLAQDGQLAATPVDGFAVSTLGLDVAPSSQLDFEATVWADSFAGLVFDYQSPTHFKYVALLPEADQIVLGHRTADGWFTDIAASKPVQAGRGYSLKVALDGTEATVLLDGREQFGWAYNALTSDGEVGLLTRGGTGLFDNMIARSDDPGITGDSTPTGPRQPRPDDDPPLDPTAAMAPLVQAGNGSWLIDARLPSEPGRADRVGESSLGGAYGRELLIFGTDREEDSPWAGAEGDWLIDL